MLRETAKSLPKRCLAAALFTLSGWAAAQTPPNLPTGYLGEHDLPDMVSVIGAPPQAGSPADVRDRQVYRETRALAGSERFALATKDAVISPQALMDDFACALDTQIDVKNAPQLARLLFAAAVDAGAATIKAKDLFKRQRPFIGSTDPVCTPDDARIEGSYGYPSGHSALGWGLGLVLSELRPERTSQIMTRARIYGESRVVCGVHTVSDIEAGRDVASAVVAKLHATPAFRADMALAAEELTSLIGERPSPKACRAEALWLKRPW